ncbi:hypothetical protein CAOG_005199 [Capsaspora owczarzaki ATCC 30864]|uniref:Uncharacterized protein n=1 Tax=Capsaspora owczarzaki (strain ATCC 30864) TaxID=595528 RepID=A0A0D2WRM3_CAPO3|nr:hypothetical protein CAOG_005199 [Capsaspora owczarzaki ATCC 30864]
MLGADRKFGLSELQSLAGALKALSGGGAAAASGLQLPAFRELLIQVTLALDPQPQPQPTPAHAQSSSSSNSNSNSSLLPQAQGRPSQDEATTIAALDALTLLFVRIPDAKQRQLHPRLPLMPPLGHCVYIVLELAATHRNMHVQVKALNVIELLLKGMDDAALLLPFLPGLSSQLCKAATGNVLQNHNVTVAALQSLGLSLAKLFGDRANATVLESVKTSATAAGALSQLQALATSVADAGQLPTDDPPQNESPTASRDPSGRPTSMPMVSRTLTWFVTAAGKLCAVIRFAMVTFCDRLLTDCFFSLEKVMPSLIDALVGLTVDDFPFVAEVAQQAVEACEVALNAGSKSRALSSMLEENTFQTLTSLPRLIRGLDDKKQLLALSRLLGYFTIQKQHMADLFNSQAVLDRLTVALCEVLEFADDDLALIQEGADASQYNEQTIIPAALAVHTTVDVQMQLASPFRKRFVHFTSPAILTTVQRLCWLLGQHGGAHALVEHFATALQKQAKSHNSTLFRSTQLQLVLILNELLVGVAKSDLPTEEGLRIRRRVLDLYLTEDVWRGASELEPFEDLFEASSANASESSRTSELDSSQGEADSIPVVPATKVRRRVEGTILSALLLEGVAMIATGCGLAFKGEMLMAAVFPMVERLAHPIAVVSATSEYSLRVVSLACGYRSTQHMISANADYLINSVVLNLRYLQLHPATPVVLSTMLRYCDASILELLRDSLAEVLDAIDNNHHLLMYEGGSHSQQQQQQQRGSLLDDNASTYFGDQAVSVRYSPLRPRQPAWPGNALVTPPSQLLSILAAMVGALARWKREKALPGLNEPVAGVKPTLVANPSSNPTEHEQDDSSPTAGRPDTTQDERAAKWRAAIQESKQMRGISSADGGGDEQQEEDDEHPYADTEPPKVLTPSQIRADVALKLTEAVLEKCAHFIPSSLPPVRIAMLMAARDGMQVLASDNTRLLPMVHKLWGSVSRRCRDEDTGVQVAAWQCVSVICALGGDFARSRFLREIWPAMNSALSSPDRAGWRPLTELQQQAQRDQLQVGARRGGKGLLLPNQSDDSAQTQSNSSTGAFAGRYLRTAAYKVHIAMLEALLCVRHLKLESLDVVAIALACLPSLGDHQPHEVQMAAENALAALIEADADAVWQLLTAAHPKRRTMVTSPDDSPPCILPLNTDALDRLLARTISLFPQVM